ncbi:MAG TPA: type II toxin-antitoxin system VapC family toxin [Acidobacteriota bacterium]|nr:type II toxin-antitoxin system VapC family toxin [Acidobacteriota bacterium]
MIFVDSNLFVYAVGRTHPLRPQAQQFFVNAVQKNQRLVTSAEVLQELLHIYIPVNRFETLDHALELALQTTEEVLPISAETVTYARMLTDEHPSLSARDLLHLATCQLNDVREIKTFDRNLSAAFRKKFGGQKQPPAK